MTPYFAEEFTPDEEDVLRRYFTNLDEPVFATEEEAMHGVFLRRLADLANAENPES